MRFKRITSKAMEDLVDQITATYESDYGVNLADASNLPVKGRIIEVLEQLFELLFPGYTGKTTVWRSGLRYMVGQILCRVHSSLVEEVEKAYRYHCQINQCQGCDCKAKAESAVYRLLQSIPRIRQILKTDVAAAFDGDPAAKSHQEVIISYPCITAIATHRIAHELYKMDVPLIPRIMSEWAHSCTGIDIHPGATIGKSFFIDHGTGVVIGETTIIGDRVKLYQGVTLGALSFPKDARGRIVKGGKRHPTIEDDVVIYAEATILGNVTIGKGAVIGGNVWIKQSVPAGVMVTSPGPELIYVPKKSKAGSRSKGSACEQAYSGPDNAVEASQEGGDPGPQLPAR